MEPTYVIVTESEVFGPFDDEESARTWAQNNEIHGRIKDLYNPEQLDEEKD